MYIYFAYKAISAQFHREYGHVWRFAFDLFIYFFIENACPAVHSSATPTVLTRRHQQQWVTANGTQHAALSSHVEWLTAITLHSYENNLSFSTPERAAWHLAHTSCTSCTSYSAYIRTAHAPRADCVRPRKAHFDMAMLTTLVSWYRLPLAHASSIVLVVEWRRVPQR